MVALNLLQSTLYTCNSFSQPSFAGIFWPVCLVPYAPYLTSCNPWTTTWARFSTYSCTCPLKIHILKAILFLHMYTVHLVVIFYLQLLVASHKVTVGTSLKFKSQLMIAFFTAINHLKRPLRKQNFTLTGSKGHCLWIVIGGFRSILCVSVFQGSFLVIIIMIDNIEKRNCEGSFWALEFACLWIVQ